MMQAADHTSAPFPLVGKGRDGGTGGSHPNTRRSMQLRVFQSSTAATPTPNPAPPRDRFAIPLIQYSPAALRPVGGGESFKSKATSA